MANTNIDVSTIESTVKSIIIRKLGADEKLISLDTSFNDDLRADSLDVLEVMNVFEKEFNIVIPDEQIEKIRTIGEAVTYIKKNVR